MENTVGYTLHTFDDDGMRSDGLRSDGLRSDGEWVVVPVQTMAAAVTGSGAPRDSAIGSPRAAVTDRGMTARVTSAAGAQPP